MEKLLYFWVDISHKWTTNSIGIRANWINCLLYILKGLLNINCTEPYLGPLYRSYIIIQIFTRKIPERVLLTGAICKTFSRRWRGVSCHLLQVFIYVWLYVAMCSYMWLYVAMCSYVWLCVAMCSYEWLCSYVWLCVAICGCVAINFVAMVGHAYLCVPMCGYVWLCVAMCGYVWLCVAMCGYVWLFVAMVGHV